MISTALFRIIHAIDSYSLSDAGVLVLDRYEGEIPARSKQTIRGVVKPLLRCQYSFEIKYELIKPEMKTSESDPQQLTTVCNSVVIMI